MKTHQICLKNIPDDLYNDLRRIQTLDNRSLSSIFRQGARLMVDQMTVQLSENRKKRNTRMDMAGF